ncbi:MAG: hypothetical protein HY275_03265 [Gemmatimonadetes bacterium]|nr:hypothetical protein [Gemmatimonadota bacterium]
MVLPALSVLLGAASIAAPRSLPAPVADDPRAVAIVTRAITRMGGDSALRAIRTVRTTSMLQWLQLSWTAASAPNILSFERAASLVDYGARAWRNTRSYPPSEAASVDIVVDTIGARSTLGAGGTTSTVPLSVAYVETRRQLFAFAPERMLLAARDAGGLRALPDTIVNGVLHARVAGTVDGYAATWCFRPSDGLPAFVRFMVDETDDYGLAPWGRHAVEIWWSNWAPMAPGLLLPRQRDTYRVGRPYQRQTVLQLAVNAAAPADSFIISDTVARTFLATQRRPMWAAPLDSARVVGDAFVTFPPFTGAAGAVRVGGQWVLLETGQAPGSTARLAQWLDAQCGGGQVAAGVLTLPTSGAGGAGWFGANARPLYAAPGSGPLLAHVRDAANATRAARLVRGERWVRVGTDSLLVMEVETPDLPPALAVYAPSHRWLYSAALVGRPIANGERVALVARLRARGLPVEWLGGARDVHVAASP